MAHGKTAITRLHLDADPPGGFKPGDLPPQGYLAWHSWADVQRKAGIGQVRCVSCRLYRTPQELAIGEQAEGGPLCRECAKPDAAD